jgi:hypothetical protein
MSETSVPVAPAPVAASEPASAPEETPVDTSAAGSEEKPKAETPKPEKRRYKVKDEGEEAEVDEDELIAGYQSRRASHRAWQAAALSRQQVTKLFENIKSDPIPNLEKLLKMPGIGHDFRQLAIKYLTEEIEREAQTPEQRELAETKRELAEARREKAERDAAREEAEGNETRAKYAQQVETEIITAVKGSGLPATQHTVRRVAFYLRAGIDRGYSLTAEDVIPLVRKDYEDEHRALFGGLDGEALEAALGAEVSEKLSKRRVERFKQAAPAAPTPSGTRKTSEPTAPETYADVAKRLARG